MRGGSRNVYQAVANGVNDKLGGFVDTECVHDIARCTLTVLTLSER